jgi:hypothetical protein
MRWFTGDWATTTPGVDASPASAPARIRVESRGYYEPATLVRSNSHAA